MALIDVVDNIFEHLDNRDIGVGIRIHLQKAFDTVNHEILLKKLDRYGIQARLLQLSLARAVVIAPKSSHITPILRSLHWLKITERIEYKLLSLTYKVLSTTQPSYLHNLISLLAALALHLWSHSLAHPHHLLYE